MKSPLKTGLIVEAQIVAPGRQLLRNGPSAGLIRLEISTTVGEVKKLISTYPSHYGLFLNPNSYGNAPRRKSASVTIALQLQQHQYQAQLKVPKSRLPDLRRNAPPKTAYLNPWIPCGPVINSRRLDVKLSGALRNAGFNVLSWTSLVTSLRGPVRTTPLGPVKFVVKGRVWTLLTYPTHPHGPPTHPHGPARPPAKDGR
jgi:hypothetical protein